MPINDAWGQDRFRRGNAALDNWGGFPQGNYGRYGSQGNYGRYGSMSPVEALARDAQWGQQNPVPLNQMAGMAAFMPAINTAMNFPAMMQDVGNQYMGANMLNAGLAAARYQPEADIAVEQARQQGQTERQENQLGTFGPLFQAALMNLLSQVGGGNTVGANVDGQRRALMPQQTNTAQYANPLLQQLSAIA
jgi:hypothetical protein